MAEQNLEYVAAGILEGVNFARRIECKGELIRIADPKAKVGAAPHWVYENVATIGEYNVPPLFEVEIINGWVKLTKSAVA
jgi:hypothetical protein